MEEQKILIERKKMLESMEDAMKMQNRANARRRAEKAKREREEFEEKLMRAFANKRELEGLASRVKGSEQAELRDQLVQPLSL